MNKKNIVSLPNRKYFPLYKIEREIGVSCDVEDLIHFAAIGELELCVKVNWQRGYDPDSIEEDNLRIFSRYDYENAISELTNLSDFSPILEYIEVAYETDVTLLEEHIRYRGSPRELMHMPIEVKGLFAVSHQLFSFSESRLVKGEVFYEKNLKIPKCSSANIYDITKTYGGEGIGYTPTAISGINYPVSVENLYVTSTELDNLIDRKTKNNDKHSTSCETSLHGNVERFAAKREVVLMAAMYIYKKSPEKCKTYTEWAKEIDIAALEFWPDTGKPPLEISGIERLLSRVFDPKKWAGN